MFQKTDLLSAKHSVLSKAELLANPVSEAMNREFLYVTPNHTLDNCHQLLVLSGLNQLPVIDPVMRTWLGEVRLSEVSTALIKSKDFLIV